MIMNKFKLIIIICLLLFLSLAGSCSSAHQQTILKKNTGKVILRCVLPSYDSSKSEAFKNFNTDIKAIFPGYDIYFNFVNGDSNAYETKIKVLLSSDTAPDVFLSEDGSFSKQLYSANAVQSLDKYLDQFKYWDTVLPSAKVQGYNGHVYAVPFDEVSYGIMEINTDLFLQNNVKIPESFDDLKTAVKQFKDRGIIPIAVGGKDGVSVYTMLEGFACTVDPQATNNIINGKATFSTGPFRQAAVSVKELMNMGAFEVKAESFTDTDAANLFYSGKAAMYCTVSRNLNTSYTKLNGKSDLLYYPSINTTSQLNNVKALSGGTKKNFGLLISSSSKFPEEAAKLAVEMSKYYNKFLYEKQGNAAVVYLPDKMDWKSAEKVSPGLKELMANVQVDNNINSGLFQEDISATSSKSVIEDSAAFMTGFLSVDDFLKEMDNSLKLK